MVIVDTHAHVSPHWYEPVESLLYQMDRNGVAHAVLVQYMGQFDNAYQFACLDRYPVRFAAVVLVDHTDPRALDDLAGLAAQGAKGVRLRPDTRSPGADPLAIWRQAAALGLVVSCGGTAPLFADPAFAQVIEAVPDLPIVLEHLGSINQPDGEAPPFPLRRQVFALARYPNVYLKLHGLGEFCPRTPRMADVPPFETGMLPLLELAYAAFGPQRLMWGSDYPPVSGREGYANALRWPMAQLAVHGDAAVASIFGGVASRLFGFA